MIDPSAHMNRTILWAMEMVRLTELCGVITARVSVLINPVDKNEVIPDKSDIFLRVPRHESQRALNANLFNMFASRLALRRKSQ